MYICSQMDVHIVHSLAYLQDLITTLAGVFAYIYIYIFHTNQSSDLILYVGMIENALFALTVYWLHIVEVTVVNAQ